MLKVRAEWNKLCDYAWPEAEALRKSVDSVLTPDEFGAQWFYLADRALPEEGEMLAQRLVRRREGQRQVLLAARDYESLARLMLPVFEVDTPNLLMPVARLKELLGEGAHLIGAGLLARIFHSGFDFDCGRLENLKKGC